MQSPDHMSPAAIYSRIRGDLPHRIARNRQVYLHLQPVRAFFPRLRANGDNQRYEVCIRAKEGCHHQDCGTVDTAPKIVGNWTERLIPIRNCASGQFEMATFKQVLALSAALTCQACSFCYVDSSGNSHRIGFIDVTVHPAAAKETFAGNVIDMTTVGLSIGETEQGDYFSVGYYREVSAAFKDNALVIGSPFPRGGGRIKEKGDSNEKSPIDRISSSDITAPGLCRSSDIRDQH